MVSFGQQHGRDVNVQPGLTMINEKASMELGRKLLRRYPIPDIESSMNDFEFCLNHSYPHTRLLHSYNMYLHIIWFPKDLPLSSE